MACLYFLHAHIDKQFRNGTAASHYNIRHFARWNYRYYFYSKTKGFGGEPCTLKTILLAISRNVTYVKTFNFENEYLRLIQIKLPKNPVTYT